MNKFSNGRMQWFIPRWVGKVYPSILFSIRSRGSLNPSMGHKAGGAFDRILVQYRTQMHKCNLQVQVCIAACLWIVGRNPCSMESALKMQPYGTDAAFTPQSWWCEAAVHPTEPPCHQTGTTVASHANSYLWIKPLENSYKRYSAV